MVLTFTPAGVDVHMLWISVQTVRCLRSPPFVPAVNVIGLISSTVSDMLADGGDADLCSQPQEVCFFLSRCTMLVNCECVCPKLALLCQALSHGQVARRRSGVRRPDLASGVGHERAAMSLHDRVVDRLRTGSTPRECRLWLKANESKSQDQAERIVRKASAAAGLRVCGVPIAF